MRRRDFLTVLAGAAGYPRLAGAQQKAMPAIGFLHSASAATFADLVPAFHKGLGEAGYVEGHDVVIEYRWAEGHNERLPELAADLVNRRVAVLNNQGSDRTEQLQKSFRRTDVLVEIPLDIHKALWEKFLIITSFGGVGAVTRASIGAIRARPETRRLLERCMSEVFAVAESRQIALPATIVTDTMAMFDTLAPDGTTSMHRDIRDGKPSELEYWNGAVVRLAQEKGVPVPTHEFIYHSLLLQEQRARAVAAA